MKIIKLMVIQFTCSNSKQVFFVLNLKICSYFAKTIAFKKVLSLLSETSRIKRHLALYVLKSIWQPKFYILQSGMSANMQRFKLTQSNVHFS